MLTHRPKSFYVREALKLYLEDLEDGYEALERIARPNRKFLTSEEVLRELEEREKQEKQLKEGKGDNAEDDV